MQNSSTGTPAVPDYLNIIIWFILIELLSLISMPLSGMVGNKLPDRGYSVARAIGIVIVTYFSWILSYILGFSKITVLISTLILCLLSLVAYREQRSFPTKKIILSNELIFAAGFFFFLTVRVYLSEIFDGEKFMDFAFLNAVIRTSTFPPPDPWFAGGFINFYYYFGYLSVGALGKICSVEPSVLFNLSIALTFALTLNLFFGIGYNLTNGKLKYGCITAIFGVLLGNIQGSMDFVSMFITKVPVSDPYYWNSSRIIPFTINEFPYFSFIQGDLHPHMLAIPFYLVVLTFLLNIYFSKNESRVFKNNLALFIFSISLGFLFPSNSWDFPVYLVLTFFIVFVFYHGYYLHNKDLFGSIYRFLKTFTFISIFSFLPYLPFYLSFNPKAEGGIGFVGPEFRTTVDKFLILFGLFLFLIFSFLIIRWTSRKKVVYLVVWIGISELLAIIWSIPLLVILFPLLALSILSFLKELPEKNSSGFISLLISVAALITLLCEIVYLKDNTAGDYYRMNTVFKFYMHLWVFLAIAASYSYYELYTCYKTYPFESMSLKKIIGKKVWILSLLFLVISCSIFPIVSTVTRIHDMKAKPSLDGLEYIRLLDPIATEGDYQAIKWIQENIKGTPVILEASNNNNSYTYTSRVSANTGLPTVLGWVGHELMWGRDPRELETRLTDINEIYNTDNKKKTVELMKKYNISYVYIGQLERQMYNVKTNKFKDKNYFEPVYHGSVQIYKNVAK